MTERIPQEHKRAARVHPDRQTSEPFEANRFFGVPETVMGLQRQIGNRAVTSLLNRQQYLQRNGDDDFGITAMEEHAMSEEDRSAKHEESQKKANERDEGLGQTDDETLQGVNNMFTAFQKRYDKEEEQRLQALVPQKIEEMMLRIEALRAPYKQLRINIVTGIRSQMPRHFMEGPNTVNNVMAAVRRAVPAFPIEGTLDFFTTNLPKITSYTGTQKAAKDVTALETAMKTDLQPYIDDWLDRQAQATRQKVQDYVTDSDPDGLVTYLKTNYGRMTQVGSMRSYYRSSHDKEEKATYGFSYDLNNTPLAVHIHTSGSGTLTTGVSLKLRSNEYGSAFVPVWMLAKANTLLNAIVSDITGGSESPRQSVLKIKAGTWPARWKRSDVS